MKLLAKKAGRYSLLDTIRGMALINMILYHGAWNLVYMYGVKWDWYRNSAGAYIWQQGICQTFILLSGFCFSMGKHRLRNGVLVSASGALVTLVTALVMPANIVLFGVLTCIGSCILITVGLDRFLKKIKPFAGLSFCLLLFLYTKQVNRGYLGLWGIGEFFLPDALYRNMLTAYLGFPPGDFYSTDYFSLLPWIFLFWTGYYLYALLAHSGIWDYKIMKFKLPLVTFMGEHSLFIYLLHQPVLFLLCEIFF